MPQERPEDPALRSIDLHASAMDLPSRRAELVEPQSPPEIKGCFHKQPLAM